MRWIRFLLLASVAATALVGFTLVRPIQQEEQAYWYVSFYSVDWAKVDSLQALVKSYSYPVAKEAMKSGKLLDYKWLIHDTGNEWNVVIMSKYRSWDAIDDGVFGAANRTLHPDSLQRQNINAAFNEIFAGGAHRDMIYTEVMP